MVTPTPWTWDETLFAGAAAYYVQGRHPYAPELEAVLANELALDGRGRLLDVGCGPGVVALRLARLFEEVVGIDPDAGMLEEGARRADAAGVANARWVQLRAEDLHDANLGVFRAATFAQSFHWMDRDRVAATVRSMLEPAGAFVQIGWLDEDVAPWNTPLPHPEPPHAQIVELVKQFLGSGRRAGQGERTSFQNDEDAVVRRAGFGPMRQIVLEGGVFDRSVDDVVASYFAVSSSAPHLFGDRLDAFEAELRALLVERSRDGRFSERSRRTEVRIWRNA